MALRSHFFTTM